MGKGKEKYMTVALIKIVPTKDNPRITVKGDPKLQELADSIKEHGVLEPGVARPHQKLKGFFDLRAGQRRYEACKLLGLTHMPLVVREMTDQEAVEITVTENLQREDLLPLEEARGVQVMLDLGWSPHDVAEHLGKSPTWVVRRGNITNLTEKWKKELASPKSPAFGWPTGHLELVSRLEPAAQNKVLDWSKQRMSYDRTVTYKDLEDVVGGHARLLRKAKFDVKDQGLVKKAGACVDCQKRSACRPGLFDSLEATPQLIEKNDRCLDSKCWDAKAKAHTQEIFKAMKKDHATVLIHNDHNTHLHPPYIKGDEYNYWEYISAKKTDKNAIPVVTSNGSDAGKVIFVKPKRSAAASTKKGKKKPKAKTEEERGNPEERKDVARKFADAWLCHVYAQHVCIDSPPSPKAKELLMASSLWSCLYRQGWGPAREWLTDILGIELAIPRMAEKYTIQELETKLLALGLFDSLSDEVRFDFPKATRQLAAESFTPPIVFFELHKKADIYLMCKSLGIEVKGSMKVSDLMETLKMAKLKPGKLTKELTEAFGLKWTKVDKSAPKSAPKAKKAAKKRPAKRKKAKKAS